MTYKLLSAVYSAINVTFSHSAYNTIEDDGFLQFALLFTNPSAFDINITVMTSDLTATGMYIDNLELKYYATRLCLELWLDGILSKTGYSVVLKF